jgi:hypothetical protein
MNGAPTLQCGDQVPHFTVRTVDGGEFRYSTIWQHANLVLVTLPESAGESRYACELSAREAEFRNLKSSCVITRDPVTGVPAPGALVADRWGEVVHVATAADESGLPTPSELLEWLDYVERRCPECEGEAR